MLAGLLHRAVGRGHDEDGTVHLRGAGDHVFNIVGVARAVDMRVVTGFRLILDVSGVDGNASFLLFGRVVDLVICQKFDSVVLKREGFGDRRRQRGLAVVNVADRTDIYMGFRSLELGLCHFSFPP